jgi:hypothetical protein
MTQNQPEKPASGPLARAPGAAVSVPEWAERLARLMDSAIAIPGTDIRIGLDPILGLLLPELGDALGATISVTLLGVAFKERVPKLVMFRMLVNIAFDAVLGAIPLVGDLFDFAFKANDKNLALIERHRGDPTRPPSWGDRLVVACAVLVVLGLVILPFLAVAALWATLFTE